MSVMLGIFSRMHYLDRLGRYGAACVCSMYRGCQLTRGKENVFRKKIQTLSHKKG